MYELLRLQSYSIKQNKNQRKLLLKQLKTIDFSIGIIRELISI